MTGVERVLTLVSRHCVVIPVYPVQQGALALLDDLTEVQVHHQFTTACSRIVYILLVTDDVKEVRAWKRVTHFAFCFEDEGFFEDRIQHKGAVDAVVIPEDSLCCNGKLFLTSRHCSAYDNV